MARTALPPKLANDVEFRRTVLSRAGRYAENNMVNLMINDEGYVMSSDPMQSKDGRKWDIASMTLVLVEVK